MMQIVESRDDYFEPRFSNGSMSCIFPPMAFIDSPRKSLYNKLRRQPLRLTVLKLDGSSFGIEVAKMGTVAELKRAVEAAFDHLPKMGPGRVSWEHVWGQFCLCHEGQKLLIDNDHVGMLGIRDGDELQFVHHASNTCNFVKIQSKRGDPDMDDAACMDEDRNHEKDNGKHLEMLEDKKEDNRVSEVDVISRGEHRLSDMLKGMFPYRKLNSSHKRLGERSSSSKSSHNMLGSLKNCVRSSSNNYNSRQVSWKRR